MTLNANTFIHTYLHTYSDQQKGTNTKDMEAEITQELKFYVNIFSTSTCNLAVSVCMFMFKSLDKLMLLFIYFWFMFFKRL